MYLVIDEKEITLKKWEIFLTAGDVSELLEYKKVFLKFLDKAVHAQQTQLASCTLRWKEEKAYNAIETVIGLKKDLEDLQWVYNKYLEDNSKK